MPSRPLTAATLAVTVLVTSPAFAETHVWRIQSLFPSGNPLYVHFKECVQDMEAMSGGRLSVDLLPAGVAVGAGGTLDAIRAGVLDGHYSYAPIWTGIEPAFAILGDLPAGHSDAKTLFDFYYNGEGLTLLQKAYARFGAHTIGITSTGVEALSSHKPVGTLKDLEGLKIRVPTGMAAEVFARLGAAPVSLPVAEAFGALEKGVVDAADIGTLAYNDALGVHQFAKHTLYPSFHSNIVLDFTVSSKKWTALPEDLQAILEAGMQACAARYIGKSERADLDVVEAAPGKGLTVHTLSTDDENRLRGIARKVWDDWAKKGDLAAAAVNAQVKFLEDVGVLGD